LLTIGQEITRIAVESIVTISGRGSVFNAAAYFVDRHVDEGRGDSVAIECGERRWTYRDVLDQVNRIGNALRTRLDVRPEERVLLLMLDGPELIAAFFGAIKIGAVPVPVNTRWTARDYEWVLRDSSARVVVISSELLDAAIDAVRAIRSVRHVVVSSGNADVVDTLSFEGLLAGASPELEAEPTSGDAPAFWLYSSGSTGSPKGCVHLQHDMSVCAESYARGVLGIHPGDRCFSVAKLFFAYGLGNSMYFPFSVGATTILWPGPVTAPVVYDIIERHRPTLFFSVPTHYAMLLAHHDRDVDLSSIRRAVSAGEALPPALFERFRDRFGIEILDGIGSTEVLHIFISNQPGRVRPGSSGVVVPGYEARLVDEHGGPVPTGELGDLIVRGDSTCAFYWNCHEQTKDTIVGHWIRTGDKYVQDKDGFFWFAGRSDDMLKVGGIWVSPSEVEHRLLEHPAVQACGVTGREDQDGLVKPVAHVVARPGVTAGTELARELGEFARQHLAEYKRPRWIEFVDELPMTATGKVQRYKLRALPAARGVST
jgi:benzoate-CoA ligase family protein